MVLIGKNLESRQDFYINLKYRYHLNLSFNEIEHFQLIKYFTRLIDDDPSFDKAETTQ